MILTIKGADFSSANIGTLSTFVVSKSIGRGASYDIPSFVEKNSSVNWVITLGEDYTFGTYSVTMGGEVVTPSVNGNEMTIAIANVTGNIRITVATVYNGVEELPEPAPINVWYIDHANQALNNNISNFSNGLNPTAGAFAFPDDVNALLIGKPINTVEFITHTAGKLGFYIWNKDTKNLSLIKTFDIVKNGNELQRYKFDVPVTLNAGEYLAFGNKGDTGKFVYFYQVEFGTAYHSDKHYYYIGQQNTDTLASDINIGVNVGYFD